MCSLVSFKEVMRHMLKVVFEGIIEQPTHILSEFSLVIFQCQHVKRVLLGQ